MNRYNDKIDLDELYDRQREIEQNRIDVYNKLLSRIHNKIKVTSRQRENNNFLFFIVPEFIFGIPKYNVNTCIAYIIDKLIDNGFIVKYTHPNLLFISWKHYIPSHVRMSIKKETGKNIDGFGNIVQHKTDTITDLLKNKNKNTSENVNKHTGETNKIYKDINTYTPSGIYNQELFKQLENKLH